MSSEHPRVCGENSIGRSPTPPKTGTSPRMRGKHGLFRGGFLNLRNIPAYAGKTLLLPWCGLWHTEHPRVCGENFLPRLLYSVVSGTSPRMRGKLEWGIDCVVLLRNIPAYAGKTPGVWPSCRHAEEHPRVCGENKPFVFRFRIRKGTSPRMRGKLGGFRRCGGAPRNIPAYAGKTGGFAACGG